jgi:probable HAF family extracellular repeat protein
MAIHRTAAAAARLCSLALMLSTLMAGHAVQAAPTYELIDLGPNTTATGINHNGHVAGAYKRVEAEVGIWRDGQWHRPLPKVTAWANGIGSQDTLAVDYFLHTSLNGAGAVLPDGQFIDIHSMLGPGTYASSASAVTSDGTVVGNFHDDVGAFSYTYRDGVVTRLPCPAPYNHCVATAASHSKGWIAGTAPRDDSDGWIISAILFDGTSWKDLGSLGGVWTEVHGVSRKGHVVGASEVRRGSQRKHAFVHAGKFMKNLGTLGGRESIAYAINAQGVVVGTSDVADSQDAAFYWDGSGPMIDLNTLVAGPKRLHLVDAVGINEAGWIVGNATYWDTYHGYLLKPLSR